MKVLHTDIGLTGICHKDCPDCYYPKGIGHMTYEVGRKVIDWVKKVCEEEQVESHGVGFVGGEPLENPDVLFQLIEGFNSELPAFTKRPYPDGPRVRAWESSSYILFTNGDLLTKDNLERLHYHNIKIRLNPTHDSMEMIKEKSEFIKSVCHGVSFAIVADEFNLPRLHEITKLAVDLRGHVRISRLYEGGKDPQYIEEFCKAMHKVFDVLLSAKKPMWPNWILESTWIIYNGEKNPNVCGKYQVVIDPNGTLRSCNIDQDTVVGHVDTHKFSDLKFHQRWSAKNLPECQGCEWITWCQGGCPYTRKATYGTYDRRSPFCPAFKELFPRLKELTDKWKARWTRQAVRQMRNKSTSDFGCDK